MKFRTNITINPLLHEKARAMMRQDHEDEFGGFISGLIRAEYNRRSDAQRAELDEFVKVIHAQAEAERESEGYRILRAAEERKSPEMPPAKPVSYLKRKKKPVNSGPPSEKIQKIAEGIEDTEAARILGKKSRKPQ